MKADSSHWIVMGEPATPVEGAALDAFRELLPDDGITTAWVNLTFIDDNGRSAEVDVLLMTRAGVFVVELKGWHGAIRGNSQRWQHGPRNVENPWLATDRKAKRLVGLLRDHAPNQSARRNVPFLQPLVVLHGYESTVDLDSRGRTGVVALDGYHVRAKPPLPRFSAFLAEPPANSAHLLDKVRAAQIRALCERADLRRTPKTRMVGDYVVADSTPIAEGPDWQDVLVDHPHLPGIRLRVRLYDVAAKASTSERQRIEKLARSEAQITHGIKHEGIAVPSEFKKTDDGPALVFEHDDAELPLDAYLAGPGAELTFEERIALVQRLGEILRFAHQRHLIHRALSPQRVWVLPSRNGLPRLSIRDWYFGQKVHSNDAATRWSIISAGLDDLLGVANPQDWIYFAPEARTSTQGLPGVPLDVFGFGALAYLVLTGRPPADNLAQLEQKLTDTQALDPRAAVPGMPDGVADVIALATSFGEADRPSSIVELLDMLRDAWDEVRRPEPDAEPPSVSDPLEAQAGDVVADRFVVTARRGEGSSGLALAVKDVDAEGDDAEREVILKVARSAGADRRLTDEAAVLRALDHRRIVRLIDGPFDVDDRTAILLTDAGKETLAARLAKEGRATLGQLQQFGDDLLDVMAYLDGKGIFHRDVKPANLGITPDPGSRRPTLVLFDLSLASAGVDNLESGTPGYLDPYLGRGRRQRYDRAAELYAVSVTLFEMATGGLPWWPDGSARPLNPRDAPVVEPGSFEPAVAVQLTALFQKALNPDVTHRFSTADELALAWQDVFASLDAHEETAESNDALVEEAVADTPLARSGLSARARSALTRLDLATVGDLLAVHPARINTIRGLGEAYRKEIQRRIKQWRVRLAATEEPVDEGTSSGTERLLATLLTELAGDERTIVEALLELDGAAGAEPRWPAPADIAQKLHLTREQVVHAMDSAITKWTRDKVPALPGVRDEAVRILAREGRVTTLPGLALALAAERGSLLAGAERTRRGAALLRAAYELDARDVEPALELRRSKRRPTLVALREGADPDLTGRDFPTADVLLEAAAELGRAADELVAAEGTGVIPAVTAVAALQAAVDEVAAAGLTGDRQLLRLAAAAGDISALSGFDELYPVGLEAGVAVELALSGKPGRQISEAAVRKSVATRFPYVRLPVAAHELDDLVKKAAPGLVRRGDIYEPATTRHTPGTASTGTFLAPTAPSEAAMRLRGSLRRHGALTLCTIPKRYVRAARDLAERFDVDTLDVAELVVAATRELAADYEIDWPFVLGVDAGPRSGSDWANLVGLVQEAVESSWAERLGAPRPLLITNAGPLVRYGLGRLLAHLLDVGNPRPAARWLLVAMRADQPVPQLEGEPVPLGPSRWITLPSDVTTLAVSPTPQGTAL